MWTSILACLVFTAVVSAQVDPRCNGAKIIKGCAYLKDNDRCDCWIRCTFDEDGKSIKSERQCCGCGMFWNDKVMTCEPAVDLKCNKDPCLGVTTNYAYPGNCRTYWTCDGTRTDGGQCCPPGQRYDQGGQTCVVDADCKDECLCFDHTTVTPPICRFRVNPRDPHTFFIDDNGQTFLQACAPGTNYNAVKCQCSDFYPVTDKPCSADFNMVCNSNPLKDMANQAYIDQQDVTVDLTNNECDFLGSSNLIVPRYANMDWRKQWAVYIAFNANGNVNTNGVLWSNSKSPAGVLLTPGSIVISLQGASVVAYLRTQGPVQSYTLSVSYDNNVRNNVYLSKDNEDFELCVENTATGVVLKDKKTVNLMTERVPCAVLIGNDHLNNYFNGVIFENRVYIYCVPKNFCP